MSVIGQGLLTEPDFRQSSRLMNTAIGLSETMTPAAWYSLGPAAWYSLGPAAWSFPAPAVGSERREITLEASASLRRQPWFHPTVGRLEGFLSLREDWNGYGEQPIHESAVKRAVAVLNDVCDEGPAPCVVPMADGGVQIEWAAGGFEIEVEVPPAGPAQILIVEPSGEETEMSAHASGSPAWGRLRAQIAQMALAIV